MTTPASAPADQPGLRPEWLVLTASERGASHLATQAPNQDSVAAERAGAQGMVAAVADGHGHSRHLRSARGSRLAVTIGCQVAQELADQLEAAKAAANGDQASQPTATVITGLLQEFLVPEVVSRWRDAVLADVAADPFTGAEQDLRQKGDDPTIAYGSTLLLGVALHGWLILAQIGDGDVVGVQTDGRAFLPVPTDPQLDGLVTTSLCGVNARSDFRVAVVDTAQVSLVAVLLATDGYGNAQVVDQWPSAFSEDLAWMLKQRDVHWLASQLPSWAARCASAEGSADDTTVALLVSPVASLDQTSVRQSWPGGSASGPVEFDTDRGSEETTIPAAPHADTVPATQIPPAQGSIEPVTVRQALVPADLAEFLPGQAEAQARQAALAVADDDAEAGDAAAVVTATVVVDGNLAGSGTTAIAEHVTAAPDGVALADQPTTEWEPPLSAGAGGR